MKKILLATLFVLLSGCVVRNQTVRMFRFSRADTTQAMFFQDRYACIKVRMPNNKRQLGKVEL